MSRRARNMSTVRGRGTNSHPALLGVLLTAISLMIGALGCDSAPDYLEMRDWHDLYAVRGNLAGHYLLMNDLDSTTAGYEELAGNTANQGRGWQPIGTPADPLTGLLMVRAMGYLTCSSNALTEVRWAFSLLLIGEGSSRMSGCYRLT